MRAGEVIAGCRLVEPIGTGGSGTVWLGVDTGNGRRVAVKALTGPVAVGERLRLRHPHVVTVHRVDPGAGVVVMEFAAGGSLARTVAARGPLDAGEVVTVVVAIAGALNDLHRSGVVHGDLSGSNVLFGDDARPLIGDLGALRLAGAGPVVATAGYVAPEVLAGAAPGPAADVYGLAACGWLALTGEAPPDAASRAPLSVLVPHAPAPLVDVVTRGLDLDPGRRPAPVAFVEAAVAACRPQPVRLVAAAMPALAAPEAVTHRLREWSADAQLARPSDPGPAPRRTRRPPPRHRRGAVRVAVAGVGLGLAGGMATLLFQVFADGASAPSQAATTPLPTAAPTVVGEHDFDAVVSDLVARRTDALRSGDAAALGAVYAPGSATGAADHAVIADSGAVDLSMTVSSVDVVTVTPRTATVTARVTLSQGVDAGVAQLRFDLVHVDREWVFGEVTAID